MKTKLGNYHFCQPYTKSRLIKVYFICLHTYYKYKSNLRSFHIKWAVIKV